MASPDPYRLDMLWLMWAMIREEPGIWSCRICREVNYLAQDKAAVEYCGRCANYANPRKQARAHAQANGSPYALHAPCGWSLNQVKGMLRDMEHAQMVNRVHFYIPDPCGQGRAWDIGARWIDSDMEVNDELLSDWARLIPGLEHGADGQWQPLRSQAGAGARGLDAAHQGV